MLSLFDIRSPGLQTMKQFYRETHDQCMVLSVDDDPINQVRLPTPTDDNQSLL